MLALSHHCRCIYDFLGSVLTAVVTRAYMPTRRSCDYALVTTVGGRSVRLWRSTAIERIIFLKRYKIASYVY